MECDVGRYCISRPRQEKYRRQKAPVLRWKMASLENEGICLSNNNSLVRLSARWRLDVNDNYLFHMRDIRSTTESRFRF